MDPLAARLLRQRGYDVVAAREVGLSRGTDDEQLTYAAAHGRTLVSFNTRHFVPLYDAWWRANRHHAGVIVSRRYDRDELGEFVRLLTNVLDLATIQELGDRLRYLGEFDV